MHSTFRLCSLLLVASACLILQADCGIVPVIAEGPRTFNFTTCPAPWEMKSDTVANSFDIAKFVGTYYELALHDWTQYPACPKPACVRSIKSFVADRGQYGGIDDVWSLSCFGSFFNPLLQFNVTEDRGYLTGYTKYTGRLEFPDTVVEVGPEDANGQYSWVIELQCVEKLGHVMFVGINFYSRTNTQDNLPAMMAAARARGLGVYLDSGLKVTYINHEGCKYPDVKTADAASRVDPRTLPAPEPRLLRSTFA